MVVYNVFTDGSFGNDGLVHGGIVFAGSDGNILSTVHVKTSKKDFVSMRNVGGEILASWSAIFSVVNSVKKKNEEAGLETYTLYLTYDYEGVGKWLTGQWKANKKATQWYVRTIKQLFSTVPNLELRLQWVKGHRDNRLNGIADAVSSYDMSGLYSSTTICDMDEILQEDYKFE